MHTVYFSTTDAVDDQSWAYPLKQCALSADLQHYLGLTMFLNPKIQNHI